MTRPQTFEPLGKPIRVEPGRVKPDSGEPDRVQLEPQWERDRRRRLRKAVLAVVVGLAIAGAAVALVLVQNAAGHYERGRQAMADKEYLTAFAEFRAAHVLFFSYRDADALASQADGMLDATYEEAWQRARVERAVRELVERAGSLLVQGDAAGVAKALAGARARVPEGPLSQDPATLALLDDLVTQLGLQSRGALDEARWAKARLYAAGLLAIEPSDEAGLRLRDRAEKGAELEAKLDAARTAATRGQWRKALRLATAVQNEWPGFPGAAKLAQQARVALAPKPSPTPTTGGGSSTPEPPPPAPEPPPPPP